LPPFRGAIRGPIGGPIGGPILRNCRIKPSVQDIMERVLSSFLVLLLATAIVHPAAAQVQPNPDSEIPAARNARQLLAPARLWKTADGKYEVRAGLLEITADSVVLKRTDNGYLARVPFGQLSQEDLEFIRNLQVTLQKANEQLQALSELRPPPIPSTDIPASRPAFPKSALSDGEVDLLIQNPERSAELAFEKEYPDQMNGQISGDQTADMNGYRRQGNDRANAVDVTIGPEFMGPEFVTMTATLPADPIPDHEVALSIPDSAEIRLKPTTSSVEPPSMALNGVSADPSDSGADTSPSVPVDSRKIDEDPPGQSIAGPETTASSGFDVAVTADLVWDSRISLDQSLAVHKKGTAIRFQLSGRDATNAFRAGELVLTEIRGSDGQTLTIKKTPPNRAGMNGAWTLIDAASRSCNAALAVPEGQVLTGIGRLKGEFKVDLVATFKTFSLPVTGDSAATGSLKEDHGISVFVRKDNRSILLETSGNVLDVSAIWLEGVNHDLISFSSDVRRRTGWYQFDCREDFPEEVVVKLKVVTESRQVTVPFEFDNLSFATTGDE
jgi:SLA1 homology domain 1, SHD1